jgi:hypothetical protein
VYGITLVWLLFESGLRGDPIARILNEVAGTKKLDANKAAEALLENQTDYLLVFRTPRRPSKSIPKKPEQRVEMTTEQALSRHLKENQTDKNVLIIPVGNKFADVRNRLDILFEVR